MNSLKINTLPFGANFYTRMPNEKELVKPFEEKTKDDSYYALNHSFISRSRFTSDVFQLLDPELEIVEKLEVDYTVDSFVRSKDENVKKLVDIYDILKFKAGINGKIKDLRKQAFMYDTVSKDLKKEADNLQDKLEPMIAEKMISKGLTSFAAGYGEASFR